MSLKTAPPSVLRIANDLEARLPDLEGSTIEVDFRPNLHAHRGQLHSESVGQMVFGGCDIKKREIILDSSLLKNRRDFKRILVHEVFHFVWARLGNPARRSYDELIRAEFKRGSRGELGWSAQYRRNELRLIEESERNPRVWREYVCESFCDTSAWILSGLKSHEEYTLSKTDRARRSRWFRDYLRTRVVPV